MKTKAKSNRAAFDRHPATVAVRLQATVRRTLPLYLRLARDTKYATKIARSIRERKFDRTDQLIRQLLPKAELSIGAGFGAGFSFGNSTYEVAIYRPGKKVWGLDLSRISRTMLPMLRKIAANRRFALRLAKHDLLRQPDELLRLGQLATGSRMLERAETDDYGFHYVVKLPNGAKYNFIFNIMI